MWTTSSSRANRLATAALAALTALATACAPQGQTTNPAPDAPLPAAEAAEPPAPKPASADGVTEGPVEVAKASIRPLGADEELRNLAGEAFLAKAKKPLVIEVETTQPLGNLWQSSLPVILLNGEILSNTQAVSQTKLVAFVEDADQLAGRNEIKAGWAGNLEATRSREGLVVGVEE